MAELARFVVRREGRIVAPGGGAIGSEAMDILVVQLAELLWDTANTEDQGLGADLQTGDIHLEVDVWAPTWNEAIDTGDAAIRSALHVAGVATPEWEGSPIEGPDSPQGLMLKGGTISVAPADEEDLVDA